VNAHEPSPKHVLRLGPAEAAIFETFVVPRYLSSFGELALEMLAEGTTRRSSISIAPPDTPTGARAPVAGCLHLRVRSLAHAIELARAKAATMPDMISEYRVVDGLPVPYASHGFSHALTLHPLAAPDERAAMMAEFARVLAPRGQALLAMPLRGSFQEISDLLREYALRAEAPEIAVASRARSRRAPRWRCSERSSRTRGSNFVDVESRTMMLTYKGTRLLRGPVTRLLLLPSYV